MKEVDWQQVGQFLSDQYGNLASVIGLFVAGVAAWKASGAKRAAEEAKRETWRSARHAISQFLTTEIARAHRYAQELLSAINASDWSTALNRCAELRSILAGLPESPSIQPEERDQIAVALDDLHIVEERIYSMRANQRKLKPVAYQKVAVFVELTARIEGRLRNLPLPDNADG